VILINCGSLALVLVVALQFRISDQLGKLRVNIDKLSAEIETINQKLQIATETLAIADLEHKKSELATKRHRLIEERKRLSSASNSQRNSALQEQCTYNLPPSELSNNPRSTNSNRLLFDHTAATTKETLNSAQVICCTLSTSGSDVLLYDAHATLQVSAIPLIVYCQPRKMRPIFNAVIVDEACQAVEVSTLIPLRVLSACLLVAPAILSSIMLTTCAMLTVSMQKVDPRWRPEAASSDSLEPACGQVCLRAKHVRAIHGASLLGRGASI